MHLILILPAVKALMQMPHADRLECSLFRSDSSTTRVGSARASSKSSHISVKPLCVRMGVQAQTRNNMCLHACMRACVGAHVCACARAHVFAHVCLRSYLCTRVRSYTSERACMRECGCICAYVSERVSEHMQACLHACMYAYVHVYLCVCKCACTYMKALSDYSKYVHAQL